jgi:acetyl esterase/lipase
LYGTDPLQKKWIVYLPGGRNAATKVAIMKLHGGGWSTGDKK